MKSKLLSLLMLIILWTIVGFSASWITISLMQPDEDYLTVNQQYRWMMCGHAIKEAEIEYDVELTPEKAWGECIKIVKDDNFDWVGNCADCTRV